MGMVAILVPPTHWDAQWNLVLNGLVVSEEKTFEKCGQPTNDGACL